MSREWCGETGEMMTEFESRRERKGKLRNAYEKFKKMVSDDQHGSAYIKHGTR
jgi:hypothetical protein